MQIDEIAVLCMSKLHSPTVPRLLLQTGLCMPYGLWLQISTTHIFVQWHNLVTLLAFEAT